MAGLETHYFGAAKARNMESDMKSYDYASSWREATKPAYDALPESAKALLARVAVDCEKIHQGPTLNIAAPAGLREAFEALDTDTLARAARIVYFLGHHLPGGAEGPRDGSSWKFSNVADQVLAVRLGLPDRSQRDGLGMSLRVHEGVLRIGFGDRDSWHWEEVALATPENLEAIRESGLYTSFERARTPTAKNEAWRKRVDAWKTLRARFVMADADPLFVALMDTERWMREEQPAE